MLYELWREVAARRHSKIALQDVAAGRRWTFGELFTEGEMRESRPRTVAFPRGRSTEFLIEILAAWRSQCAICPLEAGQTPPFIEDAPAKWVHIKTTSATTGVPRFVAFTAQQLAADARNIVDTMELREDWPNLGVISMSHSYGFSNLVLPLLLHGIPLIVAAAPLPEAVRRAAQTHSALTLPAVPAMWRAWHDAAAIPANIMLGISAGAPLPLSLEREVFSTSKIKIHNFYGATECGGIAYDSTRTPRADASYMGSALKNVHLSISEEGCLEVRGQAVGASYWPTPEKRLRDEHFCASDLVELRDGGVYLRGRLDDQINVAGRKVDPGAIESAMLQHPLVTHCLVWGTPNQRGDRGEIIVACYVARSSVTREELRSFLLERLPAWQLPREWWAVDSLQTNERGKISRTEWRQRYNSRNKG
ncbi:MAG: long-chain fatty acid--CoA ligase [Verrucomicrobia bacterium]|nr:long-chain fatty acid--CoA ligase [Verrucomicrobiota bacterium]